MTTKLTSPSFAMSQALLVTLLFVGCSSHNPDKTPADAANAHGDARTLGDASSGGGPRILNLSTNTTLMTSSDQLVVTAVVTDPEGISQVIGGTLSDGVTGKTYGAFEVSTTSGAWSITLTWGAMQTVDDITGRVGGVSRILVATFFDQAGNTTSSGLTVVLSCGANDTTDSLCSGMCFDLQKDGANCGVCGRSCAAGGSCVAGACAALTACGVPATAGSNWTCNDECSAQGGTCVNACVNDGLSTGAVLWGTDSECNTSGDLSDDRACTDLVTFSASYECCCAS
jgi:hypothetical protein